MGWLLKIVCAFVLMGILALACLSMLSIAAAIILPGLTEGQVQITGAVPMLSEGQYWVDVHQVPLWDGGLISPRSGAHLAFGSALFLMLLCCAALALARPLFGTSRRGRDAAAFDDQDLVHSLASQGRALAERMDSLETLLRDRPQRV